MLTLNGGADERVVLLAVKFGRHEDHAGAAVLFVDEARKLFARVTWSFTTSFLEARVGIERSKELRCMVGCGACLSKSRLPYHY